MKISTFMGILSWALIIAVIILIRQRNWEGVIYTGVLLLPSIFFYFYSKVRQSPKERYNL